MSALRQRMNEAMVLRGFAERTKETYLACVSGLAKHYGRSPDTLDAAAIQAYLLHLISERKLAYASVNQAVCAFRFLFAVVLGQREVAFDIPMAKVPKRLPHILSREEISRLFAHAGTSRARTLLMTTYAAGLRVSEVCALQLADIESLARPDVPQGAPRQGRQGSLHDALAPPARHLAPVLASGSPRHLAVSQSHRQRPDRRQDGAAHLPCARVRRRHRARRRHPHPAPCFCHPSAGIRCRHPYHPAPARPRPMSTTMRYFHLAQSQLTGTTSPLELLDTAPEQRP